MAKEISHGTNWLHKENIVHRDLYWCDFLGLSSGRPHFKDMTLPAIILHVSSCKQESPIDGTLNDFINLYNDAWNYYIDSRPDTTKILRKLDCIRPVNLSCPD
ncbi:calmodulin-dependent protein kinase [Gigaspora margarita]|uniref:Calmodulin-dependent protein kinase n=1 Tax=Gigaspora margarita TaxID=4874 RepID=A0A8H3WXV9_GIGMA|nr:calmodulin-dependent protein kinase [Gigaspora margarita]